MTDTSSSPSAASALQNGTEAKPSTDAIAEAERCKVVANEAFKGVMVELKQSEP